METEMGPGMVQGQRSGVQYHWRYLKPAPFVLAATMTLGFGAQIVIVHTSIGTLFGLLSAPMFLITSYLEGPANSVAVRHGKLEVENAIRRYVIPPARILSIDVAGLGVRVRVEGDDKEILIGAFSRSVMRWQGMHAQELQANTRSLTEALFATPAPADHDRVKKRYRWVNMLLIAAEVISFLALNAVINGS
jgi:hypothetical protein